MSLRTTMLTSAFATAVAVVACGGGSHKKGQSPPEDAGAAGEANPPPEEMGGAGGTVDQPDPSAGAAGMGVAGAAGASEAAGAAGEAGSPPIAVTPLQVLFTVGAGAKGLPGTRLADNGYPTSVIFGSNSATPDAVNGTNQVVITADQLGIADGDTLSAFTALRPIPESPVYLFSVRGVDSQQGLAPTRLNRSSREDGAPGDVYFSDATVSYRWLGEGGDQIGYNGLVADEQSLGLVATPLQLGEGDDLTGVLPLTDGKVPTEIYFSVSRDSVGLEATAVGSSEAGDRGCTVYKSALDGKNSVAFSCTELGLLANAQLKGLAVLGAPTPSEILFTVDNSSAGVPQSGVDDQIYKANGVFSSTANGTNSLHVSGNEFGLYSYDEIDALAVIDQTPQYYGTSSTCDLTPGPFESDGANLSNFGSAHGLGPNLILVTGEATGPDETTIAAVAAYNVKTCAFVARAELSDAALGAPWTPAPLAGWSAADPLKKLEYWRFGNAGEAGEVVLYRLDATGNLVNTYGFANLSDPQGAGFYGADLEYDASHNRLVGVLTPKIGLAYELRIVFSRPGNNVADNTLLEVFNSPLPHPCASPPDFSGVDADGNSYFAQWDRTTDSTYRVCPLTPTGEFSALPFSVSIGTSHTNAGMIVPGDSIYGLIQHVSPTKAGSTIFELSRQALTP